MLQSDVEEIKDSVTSMLEILTELKETLAGVEFVYSEVLGEDIAHGVDDGDLEDWAMALYNIQSKVNENIISIENSL